jgi:hypothetical protein
LTEAPDYFEKNPLLIISNNPESTGVDNSNKFLFAPRKIMLIYDLYVREQSKI